jgi:hypothetical protein
MRSLQREYQSEERSHPQGSLHRQHTQLPKTKYCTIGQDFTNPPTSALKSRLARHIYLDRRLYPGEGERLPRGGGAYGYVGLRGPPRGGDIRLGGSDRLRAGRGARTNSTVTCRDDKHVFHQSNRYDAVAITINEKSTGIAASGKVHGTHHHPIDPALVHMLPRILGLLALLEGHIGHAPRLGEWVTRDWQVCQCCRALSAE